MSADNASKSQKDCYSRQQQHHHRRYKRILLYNFKSKLKCRGDISEFRVTKFDFSLDDSFDVHNKCQFYDETFANKKGNPRYSSHILESLSKYYGTASSFVNFKPR